MGAFFMFKPIRAVALLLFVAVLLALVARLSPTGGRAVLAQPSYPTVILDAGHGGEDGGAVGATGVLEKDLNLEVVRLLAKSLTEAGVTVILTRDSDRMLYGEGENIPGKRKYHDLKNRLAFAERDPNALFVSIHMNSFSDSRYFGLQVWCAANDESLALAESVASSVKSRLQENNRRRVKTADGKLFLLSRAPGRAILVECGFLSNREECELLATEDYRRELSFAIFCGIMEYLKANCGEGALPETE